MKKRALNLALVFAVASAVSIGCGSDDDTSPSNNAGSSGMSGSAAASGKGGSSGSTNGGGPTAGTGAGGSGNSGGQLGPGGADMGGALGMDPAGAGGALGEGGEAGGNGFTTAQVQHGAMLVRSAALCGGCHTASGGQELAGNAAFKGGALPAPNLTPDATGIGDWSNTQIMNAIRDGKDDEGRQLDAAMPYWLFHNMSDEDALSIVAFLRSLPPVAATIGANNPAATAVTPLAPSAFPATTLPTSDANYAAAQRGKYLVSGVAQCVKCHSPASAGLPVANFFSGAMPPTPIATFASNITPDTTGIATWSADDVATALKMGKDKAGATLCGSMPSAAKGYGGLSDADAHAIGFYLTTIAPVVNSASAPTLEPVCQ
ncbi:MAG: c-type cytochrome [Polyangiaceae bacterium]